MEHFEKELDRQDIFQGKVIDVKVHRVALEDGSISAREVVHHNGGVCVAALDDQGRLLLVRQYRFAAGRELLELPAGKLEPGENPMAAAFRELEEETGYTSKYLSLMTTMIPTPGYCSEVIHLYTTAKLSPGTQKLDDGEFLSVLHVPLEEAVRMVLEGEIVDGKTQVGILMLKQRGD